MNGRRPNTATVPGLVSPLLTWETIESYNIGLDWGLLSNRLTGSFEYYVRNTKNMIGNAPELPAILGTAVPVTNNTDLRTKDGNFLSDGMTCLEMALAMELSLIFRMPVHLLQDIRTTQLSLSLLTLKDGKSMKSGDM